MATHDDFDGVYFTIQAIRMYHGELDIEWVILDNNPASAHGEAIREFLKDIPRAKYIPVTEMRGSWVKYLGVQHATEEIILGLDCHILLEPGFFDALRVFWENNPRSPNMLTGPLVYNRLDACSTHMDARWRGHDFGTWGDAPELKLGLPFEIPMQGMGCYSFLRRAWTPITNKVAGFGAEEWYMAEHFRKHGGIVICHPKLRWVHRFGRPVRTFHISMDDKVKNYYAGWLDLYGTLQHPKIQEMTKWWSDTPMKDGKVDPTGQPIMSREHLQELVATLTDEKLHAA